MILSNVNDHLSDVKAFKKRSRIQIFGMRRLDECVSENRVVVGVSIFIITHSTVVAKLQVRVHISN